MGFFGNMAARVSDLMLFGADGRMSDQEFLEREIARWKNSPQRIMQIKGCLYHEGEHDILTRKRTVIGEDGVLVDVENLPNNRIVDNQYGKLVNQKANYLLGQPFVMESENRQYLELLKRVFNKRFMKTLKNAGKAALNNGIAWLYPYYTETGEFAFRVFPGYEILPFWKDSEHTILEMAVRLYLVSGYKGSSPVLIEKVEVYDLQGIRRYTLEGGTLVPDFEAGGDTGACARAGSGLGSGSGLGLRPGLGAGADAASFSGLFSEPYVRILGGDGSAVPANWARIPLIPVKYNELEIPLLKRVKSLQDGINVMLSDFENNMQEDARNTILVLKNYDGTNLGEFRRNLATYGAVKVRYDGETKGGVETLEITVNAENYKAILEIFKKSLIENGMGYDAKDDRLSGNPNQMNIQSMYSDIDLDANDMETELQAAFEEILWFVNAYLANTGQGNFEGEEVTVIFNRDILISETEAIRNCADSTGILSEETIIGQHPWVDDPQKEMDRLKQQREAEQAEFERKQGYDPFGQTQKEGEEDASEEG